MSIFQKLKRAAGEHKTAAIPVEGELKTRIVEAIRTVYDPEIPVNVYDLGLIYDLRIDRRNRVYVKMTLTAPGCPVAGILPGQVGSAIRTVDGIEDATVELVWDPPWDRNRISEAARLTLGML